MSREHPDHESLGTAGIAAGSRREDLHHEQPVHHEQQPPQQFRHDGAGAGGQPLPSAVNDPSQRAMHEPGHAQQPEPLAALFPPRMAADFRSRWDQVQIGFVDDPRQAVKHADELVAEVMKSLAGGFADQRARLEAGAGNGDQVDTEYLRMALRSYRSFFQRLLSL
jgi:hypothetical protein